MLRRLLLGYLGLLLVVLAAFGIPFGILWANHARSDELSALAQSASEASVAAASPLRRAVGGRLAPAALPKAGRDNDTDLGLAHLGLTASERSALLGALAGFTGGTHRLVALYGEAGQILVALGPERAAARGLLASSVIDAALAQGGQAGTGEARVANSSLLYATSAVRIPLLDPAEAEHRAILAEHPGIPVALVAVAETASVVDGQVRTIALSLGALGAGILVLAALAGWALVRSLVEPLKRIELAVADLGSGDLSARAPTGKGPPELTELAETVNVMAGRLGELISAQRAFVADASHQLRTPLTALRLRLESLAAGQSAPGEEIAAVLSEVERLSRLVTGLLRLARAEEAQSSPEVVDVTEVLASRGEAWQSVAEEQGVRLTWPSEGPHLALVVAEDLEQVLDNLLDNALAVAPAGTSVHLWADKEDGWVALHVVDEGPGMPPEDRQHAFDRFWTRRAERGRGSGLGLAIVSRLVANNGGEVELRDGPRATGIDAVVRLQPA
jgi:signal transduction histidine kinase